ncbi:hypothetical protein PP485_gp31 [Gordonia phage ThankyouJordi]|uniref:Uncharacterized protein n=1 Tax=Gordonia phage ThankyouJordi TaxID=2571252 RepID=A0A4Y6EH61_9CAUD|nr:hypothetical protein PP485_gp31 [Gordonia phage ThankyouJordi]QCW22216.1 hypothetical protein SEA_WELCOMEAYANNA_31 [Gordonia phage WelcomeAyanna]QDF17792.1 hypothetical protein SEA_THANKYOUJORDI_31 [Gordonia phage ThankyouJordi]
MVRMTKTDLLQQIRIQIESLSSGAPATGSGSSATTTDQIEQRITRLLQWRKQVEAADEGDPVIADIARHL